MRLSGHQNGEYQQIHCRSSDKDVFKQASKKKKKKINLYEKTGINRTVRRKEKYLHPLFSLDFISQSKLET